MSIENFQPPGLAEKSAIAAAFTRVGAAELVEKGYRFRLKSPWNLSISGPISAVSLE
jgi:hypothetical protein